MSARRKVAVIGVGTMGAQAAWRLAARGADVIGFDRFAPGHDRSAAGGDTRIFRSAHFEDARYVPLLRHADKLWDELQLQSGRKLRELVGCLLMGSAEHQQMRTVLESVEQHDLDHEVLDAAMMAKRFPQYALDDGDVAILDRRAGYLRPELSVLTAAAQAERLGARIHRYTTVKEIVPTGNGVDVVSDTGTEHADAAVVTVGPWINTLMPDLGVPIYIRRLINAWFVPTRYDWFNPQAPAFIRTTPAHCYGIPSPDGCAVKMGLSFAMHKPVDDPSRLNRDVAPAELTTFTDITRTYMPDLSPDPVRLSVYMEGYTDSTRPVVAPLAGAPAVVVLAAFSGHGFKLSPAMGDIAADLALDGGTAQPIEFLSGAAS
jgi:sarcosine oxidase